MITRKFGLALCILGLSVTANAAETWTGILVDNMCHTKDVGDHTRSCALSDRCAGTGFGLVLKDDTFLKFDAAGSAKALSVLKATKKETDLRAKVPARPQ